MHKNNKRFSAQGKNLCAKYELLLVFCFVAFILFRSGILFLF